MLEVIFNVSSQLYPNGILMLLKKTYYWQEKPEYHNKSENENQ